MIFDKIGLLYEPFLILVHDLRLVLMILCEQHSFFYHTNYIQASCIYQFPFFRVRMVNSHANHVNVWDI